MDRKMKRIYDEFLSCTKQYRQWRRTMKAIKASVSPVLKIIPYIYIKHKKEKLHIGIEKL